MNLNEERVQNAVACFLPSIGYHPTKLRSVRERGVDIVAKHAQYGRYFHIEVKGEPGPNVKYPNAGRETRFLAALGQIVTRIQPKNGYWYGVALPSSYRDIVKRRVAPEVMQRLRLKFFFVTPNGKVELVDSKSMKKAA
jgi:hypothetical protein